MKFLLKVLFAPVLFVLSVAVYVGSFALNASAYLFGLTSTLLGLFGLLVLVTYSTKNGLIVLAMAFVISPLGLPMLAAWLVGMLEGLRSTLKNVIYV